MNVLENFTEIKTLIFDFDGVLTDGQMFILENGKLTRTINAKDTYAIKQAVKSGYTVAVITRAESEGVKLLLKRIGIQHIYMGVIDKVEAFDELIDIYNLDPYECLYMGDDIPDIAVLNKVGLSTAPFDAVHEVREMVNYISPKKGGAGCVRDVIEKVMRLNNKWKEV